MRVGVKKKYDVIYELTINHWFKPYKRFISFSCGELAIFYKRFNKFRHISLFKSEMIIISILNIWFELPAMTIARTTIRTIPMMLRIIWAKITGWERPGGREKHDLKNEIVDVFYTVKEISQIIISKKSNIALQFFWWE
jgi:hypothetical protein